MNKKSFYTFITVAVVGIGMWIAILNMVAPAQSSHSGKQINPETNIMSEESKEETEDVAETNAEAGQSTSWGLSFQRDGQSPIGNATAEYLEKFDAYYIDERATKATDGKDAADKKQEKNIYLTFDAGYENGYTEHILDVLKEEKVPAVFFLVGDYIERNPQLVSRMVEEGHTVGNHTMSHPDMASIATEDAFKKEIEDLEKLYEQATDHKLKKYYRPPQGKYSEANLQMAKELGYRTIFWSLAHVDWYENDQPTREEALNTLNSRIHPGAIVLLHSTSKTNSEILKELIQGWKAEGYKFCDMENLCP